MRTLDTIGVVGAGTMGVGAAQLFAAAGHPVVLVDVAPEILDRARERIVRNVRFYPLVQKGFPRHDPDEILGHITFSVDIGDLDTAAFVVENATERWEVKAEIYPRMDRVCPPECVFAVNTSAISITRIAATTQRPDRVIGTHFMNPLPLKPMVEVIRGFHTSTETVDHTRDRLGALGKESIVVKDEPGFATNRVMMLTINEAVFLLQDGVVDSPEDVDTLFQKCFGHSMGPLRTADLIGLDTVLLSLHVIQDSFRDDKYRPAPMLTRMVDAGLHGQKTGRGFYTYDNPS